MSRHESGPGAFAAFATEWRRVGMPGEPLDEGKAGASVAPPSWGVRLYYEPTVGAAVLRTLPAADAADDQAQGRVLRALDNDELPRAALLLTVPTSCPPCGGPLVKDDDVRFRCASCGERLVRVGQRWAPLPTTDIGLRIDALAAQYEALFSEMTGEPVEVSRDALAGGEPVVSATFTSIRGAGIIIAASTRLRGLAFRKQRGRRLVLVLDRRHRAPT